MSHQPPSQDTLAPPRTRRRILAGLALLVLLFAGSFAAWHVMTHPRPIHIAFASTLSGPDWAARATAESLAAAQLYAAEVNRRGGVDGHKLVLDLFDDRGSPAVARTNAQAIADGPAVAVLGHLLASTSLAAGPVYKAAGIPALTGQAGRDEVTAENAWYFRAATPTSARARWLAYYMRNILQGHNSLFARAADIDLVVSKGADGQDFAHSFIASSEGPAPKTWTIDADPAAPAARQIAESLAREPEPRLIVLGVSPGRSAALVKAIRRRGIRTIIVASAVGSDDFLRNFANEPEERDTPGFFTDNLYTDATVIFDTIGPLGQEFAEKYTTATGRPPSWYGASSNNAMRLLVAALRRVPPAGTARDREKIRDALAGFDSPEHSVAGLDGPLYFDARHDMPRSPRFGRYDRGRLVSAPLQLVTVQNPDLVDLPKEIAAGHIVENGDKFFWLQRVVYAGIDVAHLGSIDDKARTFNVDFYLWLRYGGDDDAPAHIEFPDLRTGSFNPAHPDETGMQDNLSYRLWRVSGDFKAQFDLHDFPFDSQSLTVRFQNHQEPREQVVYVIDTFGLHLQRPARAPIGARSAFRDLQLWRVTDLRYFVDAFSIDSTEGKPAFFDTDHRNEYGGFDAAIVVQRDTVAFMVKTLVPLFLLTLLVGVTLFFPPTLIEERTTIPVTGILTSAVLLISINDQLPALGYPVALEYIFYVFFGLCLMAMCAGYLTEIIRNRNHEGRSVAVNVVARIAYGAVVLITVAVFVWKYTGR